VHLPTAHSRAEADQVQVRQVMRPAPAVLTPDLQIESVLPRMKVGAFDAWPVADEEGLWGMIRNSELERAAAEGGSNKRIAEILGEATHSDQTALEKLPHVYPDHSLSVALERMGTSGLNVLPVVSRANLRQLIGIIALADILEAYGVAKLGRPAAQSK
jgi:CBS domain-containing protein